MGELCSRECKLMVGQRQARQGKSFNSPHGALTCTRNTIPLRLKCGALHNSSKLTSSQAKASNTSCWHKPWLSNVQVACKQLLLVCSCA